MNERLELSQNNSQSSSAALERKFERTNEENNTLKEENETLKADRDRKVDEMRRTFDREKEVLRQKNSEQNYTRYLHEFENCNYIVDIISRHSFSHH